MAVVNADIEKLSNQIVKVSFRFLMNNGSCKKLIREYEKQKRKSSVSLNDITREYQRVVYTRLFDVYNYRRKVGACQISIVNKMICWVDSGEYDYYSKLNDELIAFLKKKLGNEEIMKKHIDFEIIWW